jgi:hypothetical protein
VTCCCGEPAPISQYGGCGCCCQDPAAIAPVEPITDWNFRFLPEGMSDGASPVVAPGVPITTWTDSIQGAVLTAFGAGAMTSAAWQNTLAGVQSGALRLQAFLTPTYASVTARSWLFGLRVPTVIPAGNGPSSTANGADKNFPLYFKDVVGALVMGSQPKSGNCDVAGDLVAWLGLNAIIMVQQGDGANPRFSCFVDTLGPLQFTATTGEDPANANNGLSLGGWYDMGGDYPWAISQVSEVDRRVSDAEADAEVLYWANLVGLSGP